jgi:hypothetical protein
MRFESCWNKTQKKALKQGEVLSAQSSTTTEFQVN